jgi:PAS domain S-box-containing protein
MQEGSESPKTGVNPDVTLEELSIMVADQVSAMLAYWDKDQVCRFANSAYHEWFGKSPSEMVGKMTLAQLLGPDLYQKNLPYIKAALEGHRQVFQRQIPRPDGTTRYTIATYYPNIAEGEVKGFFVHVADITPVILLEEKLRQLERSKKREVVRSIIATREKERETIAADLRDNINQTLAYCKMMLQSEGTRHPQNSFFSQITNYIHLAIHQLNTLSNDLSPSFIDHFGFKAGMEDYLTNFKTRHNRSIQFVCQGDDVEDIGAVDKISIFRFIQDFLTLAVTNPSCRAMTIKVDYHAHKVAICICHNDPGFVLPRQTQAYTDIQNRVEYYEGTILETSREGEGLFQIQYEIR